MKQAVFLGKQHNSHYRRNRIPQAGGNRRPRNPHIKYSDQNIVKDHIQHAACNGADHRKIWLPGGDHIKGKVIHQQDRDCENQIAAQIIVAVIKYNRRKVHASKDAVHDKIT